MELSNPVQTVALKKEETELLRATDKITALYCRLLRERATASRISVASSVIMQEITIFLTRFSLLMTDTPEPTLNALAFRRC